MIPKIEYGDLYKFTVSIGVLLIGLAFALPWMILRESFDLLVPANNWVSYTPTAQSALHQRQQLIDWYSHWALWISAGLLIVGIGAVLTGLVFWWRRNQKHIDRK